MFNNMLVIIVLGFFVITIVHTIVTGGVRKAQYSGFDQEKMNSLIEEIRHENAEIRKDLQTIMTKVEAIDGMMKDI